MERAQPSRRDAVTVAGRLCAGQDSGRRQRNPHALDVPA
eukprot:COSAG02_NODE_49664_length_325_cov_0.911504_1_plen_38_part_10